MNAIITYNRFQWKHYKQVRHIVTEAFQWKSLVQSNFNLRLFSHLYAIGCLSLSNYTSLAFDKELPVGVIMGRSNSSYQKWQKALLRILYHILSVFTGMIVWLHKNDKHALEIEMQIEQTIKKLLKQHNEVFDGEVTLLALDSDYRGHGIGRSLFQNYRAFMKANHEQNFYLYTETNISTYTFYERQGLKKVAEKFLSTTINNKLFETNLIIFKGLVE
jgi:ribosomal protein S18 acetylase RimI-like enzyme